MPVPVFCCFWFQKSCTGNIFGIGRNKLQTSYFSEENTEPEDEVLEALGWTRHGPGAAPGLAAPGMCLGTPSTASRRLFAYKKPLDLKVTENHPEIQEKFRRGRRRQP